MVLALSAGFFACNESDPVPQNAIGKEALAANLEAAAFPDGEANDEVAAAILSLLADAKLEDAESIALLTALIEKGETFSDVYLDIKASDYTLERAALYRDALAAVAASVGSPEVAGRIYYAAAKKRDADLPYTSSDCEKLAALLLGQNLAVGNDILEAIHAVLERTPPQLVGDLDQNGIIISGGGSLVYGMDRLIERSTGIRTLPVDDPVSCATYGAGKMLKHLDEMKDGMMNFYRMRQLR